ncbi:MAG: TolC family outer membrane protein [Alphaproteobacteria bacterium]
MTAKRASMLGMTGLALGCLALLVAGTARAETLTEALARAYNNNPTLLAARAQLRATDEEVPQALSNWRPTVTLSGDIGREREDSSTGFASGVNYTTPRTARATVSQPLFRGGRTIAEVRRAENEVRAERARLHSTEQDVLLSAVRAYMDVFRDAAVVALNVKNEQRLRRQLQAARDRFEVGEVTRTDVSQAQARLARATADRIQAEGDLISSRAVYRNIIGEVIGKPSSPSPLEGLPANEEEALSLAGAQNPDVVTADFNEKAARDNIKEVGGELLPELNLRATVTASKDTRSPDSKRDSAEVMAVLTVPLYQAGSVYSRLREAKEVAGQRRLELDEARRNAREAATRAWESLQTERARVRSFEAEVRANEIALEGVQQEALVGSRTVLDVLDAEQELLDAQVNLVRSQRDETVAGFALKSAIGQLTARNLELPVKLYDFERNYRAVRDKWFGSRKKTD